MESQTIWRSFSESAPSPTFLNALASIAPVLIPLLAVFSYEAPISLRVSIAIKQAQQDSISSLSQSERNERTVSWISRCSALAKDEAFLTEIMKLVVLVAVAIDIVLTTCHFVEASRKDAIFFILMFIPAGIACVKVYRFVWLSSEKRVVRNGEGGFFVTEDWGSDIGTLHKFGSLVFAFSLLVNAFLSRTATAVYIMLAALVHPLLRSSATIFDSGAQSTRFFASCACGLALTATTTAVGFTVLQEQIDIFTPADKTMDMKWAKWIMSILLSPFCFSYIAFLVRLDYAFANHNDGLSNNVQQLPNSLDLSTDGEKLRGTLVPPASSIPSFGKPYYTAAWIGYLTAALCLALLCSVPISAGPPLIKMDEPDIMGFYLIFLAPPLISVFVMVLAFWKGEFSQVWAYEEKWNVPKQDAKQIVDSKVTDEVSVMN